MPGMDALLIDSLERSFDFRLHGADATGIGPGHTTGWRRLPGCTIAHLVGTAVTLELDGAPPLHIAPGEGFCIAPMVHHRSSVCAGDGLSRWALFTCTIFGAIDLMTLFELPLHWHPPEAAAIGSLAVRLGACQRGAGDALHQACQRHALAFELVAQLLARAPLKPHALALLGQAERLAPVLEHIEANLGRPLTRTALARRAKLSPSRFTALFQQAVGMAPIAYLAERRLRHAQQLLLASMLPVAEVAAAVGIEDAFYFSRWFRAKVGHSPAQYRRLIGSRLAGGPAQGGTGGGAAVLSAT